MTPSEKLLKTLRQPEESTGVTFTYIVGALIGMLISVGIDVIKVRIILYILGY